MGDTQRPKENAPGWLLPQLAKLRCPLVQQMRRAGLGSSCISCNYIIWMNANAEVAGVHVVQTGKQDILFWYSPSRAPGHPQTTCLRSRPSARYAVEDGRLTDVHQFFWAHHLCRDSVRNLCNADEFQMVFKYADILHQRLNSRKQPRTSAAGH